MLDEAGVKLVAMMSVPLRNGNRLGIVEDRRKNAHFLVHFHFVKNSMNQTVIAGYVARDITWRDVEIGETRMDMTVRQIESELVNTLRQACEMLGIKVLTKQVDFPSETSVHIPGVTFRNVEWWTREDYDYAFSAANAVRTLTPV